MALARNKRLIKKKDFETTFSNGESFSVPPLHFKYLFTKDIGFRLGLVVPARVFKRAVDRNKAKRNITQTISGKIKTFPYSVDLVIIVRSSFNLDESLDVVIDKAFERILRNDKGNIRNNKVV